MKTTQKITERCIALETIILGIAGVYPAFSADQQKLVSTSIGAAIFYIPQTESLCYSGKMSRTAYEMLLAGEKVSLTKEHQMPRRVSALELIHKAINNEPLDLEVNYLSRYAVFNYVTPKENKKLIPYQKSDVFSDPETAYSAAGIELVDVPLSEYKRLVKRKTGLN